MRKLSSKVIISFYVKFNNADLLASGKIRMILWVKRLFQFSLKDAELVNILLLFLMRAEEL